MRHPAIRPSWSALGAGLVLPLGLAANVAMAQDASPVLDRASVRLGGYYASTDTDVSVADPSDTLSGRINLEDDLGFDQDKAVPRVRADFLFGEHQGLALDYYNIDRSSHQVLARDISYDGVTYSADADVHARLDFDFGSAAWRWWFGQGDDAYGVGLGAGWYQVKTALVGDGAYDPGVGGEQPVSVATASNDSAWAPMLQLGWRHLFSDDWRIYLDASGVRKNGGRISGHIYNAALGVEWLPWRNLGFGLEYGYSQIKLHWRRSMYDADLDMTLSGPPAFVKLRW
ncbi:hypothetical protein [Fulvimonas yonginensis]|uniref:Outer membrane protein beta-barrel domain-containing protein n=1 Tax=Fulvimonas yonginensis TaxID=1495200 RepID=A0ABU8JDM3_9GAMM